MHSRLIEILAHKRKEIAALRKRGAWAHPRQTPLPVRDFKGALRMHKSISVIAEIKFASPSAGPIREKTDTVSIGRIYEEAGAAAISLLTDDRFFRGDVRDLPYLKKSVSLPILRKDFILDPCQVTESFTYGADAILLIARILSKGQLKELLDMSNELGMTALSEVHDAADIEKAIEAGADVIGINNRDLDTFQVDLGTTLALAPLVPKDCIIVSESGISTGKDVRLLKKLGVDAVLVGTALMGSKNLEVKTKELVEAARREKGERDGKSQGLRHNKQI
ncbi:MAG: indole-3-glycerol phosphate synthase TrpC [Thermoplasmata archaeon]|nr:MAG: indole-3-glycerol phosphate synthase TrpC [Thermoplasmata archaeon]